MNENDKKTLLLTILSAALEIGGVSVTTAMSSAKRYTYINDMYNSQVSNR